MPRPRDAGLNYLHPEPAPAARTAKAAGSWKDIRRALLVALACLALQNIPVAYRPLLQTEQIPTSMAHLQWGLILAVAMLAPPLYLRTAFVAAYLGWATQMVVRFTDPLAGLRFVLSMLPLYIVMYGWTVLCVRWMGWPRPPGRQFFRQRDILPFCGVALTLYPLGWTLGYALSAWLLTAFSPANILDFSLQTLFARYFGVLAVTLPVVLLVTGRHEPAAVAHRVLWWEWLVLAVCSAVSVVLLFFAPGADLAYRVLDQRYLAMALIVWAALRLPWRWCVPLMTVLNAVLILAVAAYTQHQPTGAPLRLFQFAFELGVMQQVTVLVLLIARNQQRALQQLAADSRRDGLSGVPNINALRHDLLGRHAPVREIGCLSIEHVDNLTAAFGLRAQEALTAAVYNHLRPHADVYTLGLGRFALVPREQAVGWLDLLEGLERFEFRYAGTQVRMEPHLGVCAITSEGGGGEALETALHGAYQAMRRARDGGETLPVFATTDADYSSSRQAFQTHSLALSLLRQNAVELHIQPIRRIGQQQSEMAEVLCRLRGPEGLLMPADYMAELEASRGVVELDRAVVENVLEWMRQHSDHGGYRRLTINLTGRSLVSEHFRNWLLYRLDGFPGAAQRLCFEVTERAIEGGISRATPLLEALHQRGCMIALDDFGTGMQSFDRLQQLPIQLVKIDGAFIRNIVTNIRDRELVRAMVTIANAYQAETVAEYVEDAEILRLLRSMGVNWAQGYFIGKPHPLIQPAATAAEPWPYPEPIA